MGEVIHIGQIESMRLRADTDGLPTSSLGAMTSRNGLLVRVEDADGAFGWGEVWANFPPHASQSRQQLLETVIAPELIGRAFDSPGDLRTYLERRWSIMATHVGEPGPFGHCIAGLDMAMWDLAARRADMPLSRYLGNRPQERVRVYASTLDPARAPELARQHAAAGHRAFKLKVGIDTARDEALVNGVRNAIGEGPAIMVDANQRWSVDEAAKAIEQLSRHALTFVEEPIAANAPMEDWIRLADRTDVPLAAGENICSDEDYRMHLEAGALTFYQPDVAKWGGIGGCFSTGRTVKDAGAIYCPHYMGTAIGLAASLHLLAAVGGDGYVELDSNDNPLRTDLCDLDLDVSEGHVRVPDAAGIGVIPDPEAIRRYQLE